MTTGCGHLVGGGACRAARRMYHPCHRTPQSMFDDLDPVWSLRVARLASLIKDLALAMCQPVTDRLGGIGWDRDCLLEPDFQHHSGVFDSLLAAGGFFSLPWTCSRRSGSIRQPARWPRTVYTGCPFVSSFHSGGASSSANAIRNHRSASSRSAESSSSGRRCHVRRRACSRRQRWMCA